MTFGLEDVAYVVWIGASSIYCFTSTANNLKLKNRILFMIFVSIFKVDLLFLHIFVVKKVLSIVKPMFTVDTVVAFTVIITLQRLQQRPTVCPHLRTLNGNS